MLSLSSPSSSFHGEDLIRPLSAPILEFERSHEGSYGHRVGCQSFFVVIGFGKTGED